MRSSINDSAVSSLPERKAITFSTVSRYCSAVTRAVQGALHSPMNQSKHSRLFLFAFMRGLQVRIP